MRQYSALSLKPKYLNGGDYVGFEKDELGDVIDYVDLLLCLIIIFDIAEVETPTWRATSANGIP